MAVCGYGVGRLVSAASLGLIAALATSSAPYLQSAAPLVILLPALSFVAGLFLHRAAALLSASVVLSYAAFRLAGINAGPEYLIATSLAAIPLLWAASRGREYVPYAVLGSSAFAYFTSFLTHGTLAALLAAPVALLSCAVQERARRIRSRYERLRSSLARYRRSASMIVGRPRRLREKP